MSPLSTYAISQPETRAQQSPTAYLLSLVPGTALLFGLGLLGKVLEMLGTWLPKRHHIPFPHMEYVLWAIILGLLFANLFELPRI
ncbi:MAG: putative sulfate exporter family transporter, partial [Acidobacteriaceae bacterium]|nr:putative sulfate exporter family transporter [Acidobacteriaceae bacterium]